MGKRGPKPKPSALKKQQGTYRRDRVVSNEMTPRSGAPECPAHLVDVARAEWDRVVPELQRSGVLTLVDGAALEGYCETYAMAVRFQALAKKAPLLTTTKIVGKGKNAVRTVMVKANPAVAEARRHWQLVRQFQGEFGLTPAARTRVATPDGIGGGVAPDDGSEDFLFGGLKVLPGGKGSAEK